MRRSLSFSSVSLLFVSALAGCSSADAVQSPAPASAAATPDPGTEQAPPDVTPPPAPVDDPGPAPAGCGAFQKDADGFFTRTTAEGDYVGYVPKAYDGTPTRLVVGLHGCGDEAYNFATWGVNPYDTRDTQSWIGISIDGASRGGGCWSTSDASKVLAAIDDIATCVYVHKQKVVLAGFSSGGELAYSLALKNAGRFAGLLIENSTLSAAGSPDALLAGAAWKINVAHLAHTDDSVFPIAKVRADWSKIQAAGFPLQTDEVPGDHDGTSDDWAGWLLPKMDSWKAP
jgi:pimeloyl-ACP methyl ester carboxylesterase